MKFGISKERLIELIEKYIEIGNIHQENGQIYLGEECVSQSARVMAFSEAFFKTPNEKYHKWANDAIEVVRLELCNITPMRVAKLCLEHKDKLTQKAYNRLLDYLQFVREDYLSVEHDFVGVNDNFPFIGTYTVIALWLLFDDKEALEVAKRRFNQIEALLKRRGVISEYNSGYTQFQLWIIASLEKIAPTDEWKRITKNVQNRVWFDYICHFHNSIGTCTGPFARQYLAVNEREEINFEYYELFNPEVKVDIQGKGIHYESLLYMTEEYECDDEIFALMKNKRYPFEFMATTEYSASTDSTPESLIRNLEEDENTYEYSAGESNLYTYMTEYYGIGTATKEWHSGVQTSSFTFSYKTCKNPKLMSESRSVFARYLLNDETVEIQRFFEQGRKTVVGMKNHAVVLYKPKIAAIAPAHNLDDNSILAQHYRRQEITGNLGVTSAKLVLGMPLNGVLPEKIVVDGKELENCTGEFKKTHSIYIKDGDVFWAIHPLEITDKGRDYAMKISVRDDMLEIDLFNYSGDMHDFARRDFLHVRNGFAFTAKSVEECENFEKFIENEEKTKVSDEFISTVHSRQTLVRSVSAEFDDMKLACEISPASEGIKFITCNDYPIERPKLFATGFDVNKLPYMKKD